MKYVFQSGFIQDLQKFLHDFVKNISNFPRFLVQKANISPDFLK